MKNTSRVQIALLVAAAAYVGCKSDKPAESPQGGQSGFANAPATATTTAPPPATTTAPPPATTTAPPPATTTAPALDPAALGVMLSPLLTPLAQKHAPGMKAEGQPILGFAQQGVPLERQVTLQPGKCYTAIAGALPPVADVSIELVLNAPPAPQAVLSQSTGGGLQPVMAPMPNCFKNMTPLPGPAILRVTSKQGSGPVMAQLYVK
ncbi:MAG: hypothetical protein IT374_27405 [Polyangiaceae bacterium]|nr:hypothetical protein [Polyangiaceae bacterium]